MSVTNTVIAVILTCFKRPPPRFPRFSLSRTMHANHNGETPCAAICFVNA
jgi:hypothetical protein